jgi:hypothetical protein
MRIAAAPMQLLTYVPDWLAIPAALCGACLYVIGVVPIPPVKVRWTSLWGLWLAATVGVVAALDLGRGTDHLYFIRYILLAGPAVYALIPLLLHSRPRLMHAACTIILIACCWNLPSLWSPAVNDPRQMAREILPAPGPGDLLIIAAAPEHKTAYQRYLPGARLVHAQAFRGLGNLWILEMDQSANPPPV